MAPSLKSMCLILVLLVSSSLFEARPLHDADQSISKGLDMFFDGLYIEGIKTGGPSNGGKGHAFTNTDTLGTNSGPSGPGEGH
ncbi:hypothetical protein SLEP1_g16693 [Rubroshorea leprosula]|uniref:Transmembrane protein n=1 Tax=Rubroshorea leprosula TaxID=152421 RepID=A0AAV5IVI3_9ROSI|nr:hypothetical protein SLEP1_g16693 [Rubroshorea leprosula]